MKRFLAVTLITLGISSFLNAHEQSKQTSTNTQTTSGDRTSGKRPVRRTRRKRSRTAHTPVKRTTPPAITSAIPWGKFTSGDGRFSVLIPGTPTDKTEIVEAYTTHLFTVRDDINRVFLVGWVDYPSDFHFNRLSELELNRDNFVSGIHAKLLSSRTLIIDGYQVLEFTAETEEKTFKSRVYIVGRRPYQIVIGIPKGQDDRESVNKFLNSFKVSLN